MLHEIKRKFMLHLVFFTFLDIFILAKDKTYYNKELSQA